MPNAESEFRLACGCHNPIADVTTAKTDGEALDIATLEKRLAEEDKYEAPGTAFIFTISENAVIRPVADGAAGEKVEALGIAGDKVVAAGDRDIVEKKVNDYISEHAKETPIITRTLTGTQTLIPGMIEPHLHLVATAMTLGWKNYGPFGDTALDDPDQEPPMTSQRLRPCYNRDVLAERMRCDVADLSHSDAADLSNSHKPLWLLGTGVDTSLLGGRPYADDDTNLLNYINAAFLDGINATFPDDEVRETTPIFLIAASCHTAYANTEALKKIWEYVEQHADHDIACKNLQKKYQTFQEFMEQTNGVLQEIAEMDPAIKAINRKQIEQMNDELNDHLQDFLSVALSRGATMIYDAAMSEHMYELLLKFLCECAKQNRRVANRIGMAYLVEDNAGLDKLKKLRHEFSSPRENTAGRPDSIDLYFGSVKVIFDGSNQGLTGYQHTPYCCPPPDNYGIKNFPDGPEPNEAIAPDEPAPKPNPPDDFVALVKNIHAAGWPAMIHANGDQAIQYTLSAYGTAAETYPEAREFRNRIEHCSLMVKENVTQIKELNISPSFLIGHVGFWGWVFKDYIFKKTDVDQRENKDNVDQRENKDKATKCLDLCQSIEKASVKFSLHSDCSVSPIGPLRLMEQAVTRKMEGSPEASNTNEIEDIPVLNPEERLSATQALRSVTHDAAWQCHADHLIGSLEENKLADFVILEKDPVAMDADSAYMEMRKIPVEEVWIGGSPVEIEKNP